MSQSNSDTEDFGDDDDGVRSKTCWKTTNGTFHKDFEELVRPYIDLIDSLRSMGIDKDLALPAIAVIGDQSSGKSSVLEALSGVALPRGSGIVTRCPLELKLKKLKTKWKAVLSYGNKTININCPSEVESHVKDAQNELAGDGLGISDELISLQIMSPDVCDLTIIDLPGIARVPVGGQPDDIADQIRRLIMKFIEKTETINLVVVPSNVDIATTEALKMAQEVDPDRQRTLAVLTKPDLMDRGTEKDVIKIVRNKVVHLNKGYIVVKCRGQQQINDNVSLAEATKMEREFFEGHREFSCLLHEGKATIQHLSTKLSKDLVNHIKKSLPQLTEQVKKQLWETRNLLTSYKDCPPLDPNEQKIYLLKMISDFNDKSNQLYLGKTVNKENIYVRLRTEFKNWKSHLEDSKGSFYQAVECTVNQYDTVLRGRELPGFAEYSIFESVVQQEVQKLQHGAEQTMTRVGGVVMEEFNTMAGEVFKNFQILNNVTWDIIKKVQSEQVSEVLKRITEQFQMEMLVFTQDDIFYKCTNHVSNIVSRPSYQELLKGYYKIVLQRLADQIPMQIRLFQLKRFTDCLIVKMLELVNSANLNEILQEDTEVGQRRIELQNRLTRLNHADQKLSNFM